MTEKQKEYIYSLEPLINGLPGGEHIRIFIAGNCSFCRIQHTKNNKAYRMTCIGDKDGRRLIKQTVMNLAKEIIAYCRAEEERKQEDED